MKFARPTRWLPQGVLVLALVLLGALDRPALAGPLETYRAWQSQRSTNAAQKAFAAKRYDEAVVAARRAIQLNPANREAIELMADVSLLVSPAEAVKWRTRITSLHPHDPDAWVALAETATSARQFRQADDALRRVPEEARGLRFDRAAAGLALAVNNRPQAIDYFRRAIARPEATAADRFNLSALELVSGDPVRASIARESLEAFCADPDLAEKAHRLLASDGISAGAFARARPHVEALLARPQVQFEDVLIALDLFLQSDRPRFDDLLKNCFERFHGETLPASQLVRWLTAKGLLAEARASASRVSAEVLGNPTFQAALTAVALEQKDWAGLLAEVKDADWRWDEYLRIAYELKARRELGTMSASEGADAWRASLARAEQTSEKLAALYHLAMTWGWRPEAEAALWAAADATSDRRQALEALWRWYDQERNTGGLFRVANRLLELDFNDRGARNNVVVLGALLGINNGAFREWAKENWEKDRGVHPQFGTTYAFTLFRDGDLDNAVRVLNTLDPRALQNASDALYAGIIRAAAGDRSDAQRLLATAERGNLLPEERNLLVQSRSTLQ